MKGTQKLFAVLSLMILAFGFLPLLAQPLPYEGQDWLTYEATMYYGDSFEPDDSRALARQCLVNSSIQFHNFHTQGDQDWIWFQAQSGLSYTIKTDARTEGSLADTVVELYDHRGMLISSNDDGGDMTDSLLQLQATFNGIYYVKVTEWAGRYGSDYWYHFSVTTP
jgi:hypothetical protein